MLRTGDFKVKPWWDPAHWVPWQQGHCSRAQGSATLWSDLFPPPKGMSPKSYAELTPHPSNALLLNCKMQQKIFIWIIYVIYTIYVFKIFQKNEICEVVRSFSIDCKGRGKTWVWPLYIWNLRGKQLTTDLFEQSWTSARWHLRSVERHTNLHKHTICSAFWNYGLRTTVRYRRPLYLLYVLLFLVGNQQRSLSFYFFYLL